MWHAVACGSSQVPENQRMNAEKKRRQMFLLEDRTSRLIGDRSNAWEPLVNPEVVGKRMFIATNIWYADVCGMIVFDPSAHQPFETFHGNRWEHGTPKAIGGSFCPIKLATIGGCVCVYIYNIHIHTHTIYIYIYVDTIFVFTWKHIFRRCALRPGPHLFFSSTAHCQHCPEESIHAIKTEFNQRVPGTAYRKGCHQRCEAGKSHINIYKYL